MHSKKKALKTGNKWGISSRQTFLHKMLTYPSVSPSKIARSTSESSRLYESNSTPN